MQLCWESWRSKRLKLVVRKDLEAATACFYTELVGELTEVTGSCSHLLLMLLICS